MTPLQKVQITEMRERGDGYGAIAAALNIAEGTVKSYCRRNLAAQPAEVSPACPQCGAALTLTPRKRLKRFCSDKCRLAWWKSHPEKLNRKAVYSFNCTVCGKPFTAYGNAHRKYCSRACYGLSRRACHE
jgi:endogenous inhibitor of DNA gyrase (YacG/DUF329 family)